MNVVSSEKDPFVIKSLKAFVSVDENGTEGVCAFSTASGWMPMVCANEERVEHCRPLAKQLAASTGQRIVLVEFSQRTDLEVIS